MEKDPVCGMDVNKSTAIKKNLTIKKGNKTHYFCSDKCKNKFSGTVPFYQSEKFSKVFPAFLGITLITFSALSIYYNFMLTYMGIFFIIFSLMKMPEWKKFITAFSEYDLIAMRFKPYAAIYPALEFTLGVLFLLNIYLVPVAWTTLFIMAAGGLGVSIKLAKKEKFQCACLGTKLNVPLTKVTLLENIIMGAMAIMLLFL